MVRVVVRRYAVKADSPAAGWVPVSYPIGAGSVELRWGSRDNILALCRGYTRPRGRPIVGDVWLAPALRGKKNERGVKYSALVFGRMFAKIEALLGAFVLHVHPDNYAAKKLYSRLGLQPTGKTTAKGLEVWTSPLPRQ